MIVVGHIIVAGGWLVIGGMLGFWWGWASCAREIKPYLQARHRRYFEQTGQL